MTATPFPLNAGTGGPRRSGCLIIAEAGTSHGGDEAKARDLVAAAHDAGADCVKFQAVFADEIVHPAAGSIDLPGGRTAIFEAFRRVEVGETFYAHLREHCGALGISFLCTPFGVRSARMLRRIGVDAMKIASPEVNHTRLLAECASYRLPTIISTGVSRIGDIERAIDYFTSPVSLLHCITSYPAPPTEYNLRVITSLGSLFGLPVGVSDHSSEPDLVPVLSVLCGGSIIEKHLTLSKKGGGLDDPVALDPEQFAAMVALVRRAETDPDEARGALVETFGAPTVDAVEGDGVKRLAPSEARFYETTNRSVIAVRDIERGERFTETNTALLRSETNIAPGLDPKCYDEVLERTASRAVRNGFGVRPEDVGDRAR
jgi:sialic acid synthase SpsE